MSKDTNAKESPNPLEDERAIRQTILTMFRASDEEDWETMRGCLTADFSMSVSAEVSSDTAALGGEAIRGADMMLTVVQGLATRWRSLGVEKVMHILGDMIVQVTGDEARASACHTSYLCRG